MPSPFPGMDPYIEKHKWEDFHPTFNRRDGDLGPEGGAEVHRPS
jgi:hypothetical protein